MPGKVGEGRGLGFEPFGGRFFEFFDGLGDGDGAGESVEDVNMVLDGVDEDDGAIEGFTDLPEIGMEGRTNLISQKWKAFFRREDQVDVDVREGLGHWWGIPFSGAVIKASRTRSRVEKLSDG